MAKGFGSDYSKHCTCEVKNKENWFVKYDWRKAKGYAYVECKICGEFWKTKATYVSELLGEVVPQKKNSYQDLSNEDLLKGYVNAIVNSSNGRANKLEEEILKRMDLNKNN